MKYAPVYDCNDDTDLIYTENDYPWIEFSINGTKYDINSKYLYGGRNDE